MSDMELESLRGGSYFWKGGSRKGGFGRAPRTPPPLVTVRIISSEQQVHLRLGAVLLHDVHISLKFDINCTDMQYRCWWQRQF